MTLVAKNVSEPDHTLSFANGGGVVVELESLSVGKSQLDPGWRWSNDVAPRVGAASCQHPHTGILLAGQLHVEMDDGATLDLHEGDVFVMSAGHDAWVVGDVPVKMVEWSGTATHYLDRVAD
jgi:hypothetical protein